MIINYLKTKMENGILKLRQNDFVKGLVTAIFAGVVTVLYSLTADGSFDLFTADWHVIGMKVLNISITTFIAYMAKNLLSTDKGSVLNLTPEDK